MTGSLVVAVERDSTEERAAFGGSDARLTASLPVGHRPRWTRLLTLRAVATDRPCEAPTRPPTHATPTSAAQVRRHSPARPTAYVIERDMTEPSPACRLLHVPFEARIVRVGYWAGHHCGSMEEWV